MSEALPLSQFPEPAAQVIALGEVIALRLSPTELSPTTNITLENTLAMQ
jgi:hypothetical protein